MLWFRIDTRETANIHGVVLMWKRWVIVTFMMCLMNISFPSVFCSIRPPIALLVFDQVLTEMKRRKRECKDFWRRVFYGQYLTEIFPLESSANNTYCYCIKIHILVCRVARGSLLGNDHEISKIKLPLLCNGSTNKHVRTAVIGNNNRGTMFSLRSVLKCYKQRSSSNELHKQTLNFLRLIEIWPWCTDRCLIPRQTGGLTVGRNFPFDDEFSCERVTSQ
jgi:hypothetical protein